MGLCVGDKGAALCLLCCTGAGSLVMFGMLIHTCGQLVSSCC